MVGYWPRFFFPFFSAFVIYTCIKKRKKEKNVLQKRKKQLGKYPVYIKTMMFQLSVGSISGVALVLLYCAL